jgi:hypothetical protein
MPKELVVTRYTLAEWRAEAALRFGPDPMDWQFVCPVCEVVTSVREWKEAGASEGAVAFSCIGRYKEGSSEAFGVIAPATKPCNYTQGGLFKMARVCIVNDEGEESWVFDFAPAPADSEVLRGRN